MSEGAAQTFQRRTVLVKRSLQLKYAAIVFASVLLTAFIVVGGVYYTLLQFIQRENPALMPTALEALQVDLVKLALFLGIMFLVSLFVSHRFAGPIYRFERSAQAVASGDLTHRVSLRTGDDLIELQDEMNAMVASLQRLVQSDRTLAERLCARLDSLADSIAAAGGHAAAGASSTHADELRAIRSELEHITRSFRV